MHVKLLSVVGGVAAFVSMTAGAIAFAMAANGKCCGTVVKLSECSGCIGWDDNNDGTIDYYMNIGNHGGKKCKAGDPGDTCNEVKRTCAVLFQQTTYSARIFGNCTNANGVHQGPTDLQVDQCGDNDDACPPAGS